ncbi:hypothetical protein GCM10009601_22790 [Streptomyces thermospinosisporus]|uniref:Alpha/beta hydrolase n=1 Tax=Streptomyces thermospinosisporus TaxID=161482 RepID=A0ABN1YTG5_9ACTN
MVQGGQHGAEHPQACRHLGVRQIPAHLATVEGTAHYPNEERPDVYNALVTDFLGSLQ